MADSLGRAEYLAGIIGEKIGQLLSERSILRKEFTRKSFGSAEQEKAFVHAYQNGIIDNALSALRAAKLEHMLMIK